MKEIKCEAPFMRWFTADGLFVAKPFQQFLAASIPIIGEADANSAAQSAGKDDVLADAVQADGMSTGTSTAGGKRRKG